MRKGLFLLLFAVALSFGGLLEELTKELIKDIPLEKAIVVGSGKKELITVVNPDCPHCRAEWKELKKHLDKLKIYVFLFPFKTWGQENIRKANYIACADDPVKALDEVLSGKLDGKVPKVDKCSLVEEHLKVVEKLGVQAVPYNIIVDSGKVIEGFSRSLIKELGLEEGDK